MRLKLTSLVVACGLMAGNAHADIALGALFPMSGPNAVYADIFGAGVDLAVKHANDDEKLSSPLRVYYEDSQALPQEGLIGMNKLVNVQEVPYVLSACT